MINPVRKLTRSIGPCVRKIWRNPLAGHREFSDRIKVLPLSMIFLLWCSLSLAQEKEYKILLNNGNAFYAGIVCQGENNVTFAVKGGEITFQQSEIKEVVPTGKTLAKGAKRNTGKKLKKQKKISPKNIATFDELIVFFAKKYDLDPALIKAVIRAESDFNQYCVSYKGACGLMQLMPATAQGLGVFDIYSPHQNIEGGTRYLAWLLREFGDIKLALAGYNAGPENVKKYGGLPPFSETKNYVSRVLQYWQYFATKRISIQKPIFMYTDAGGNIFLSDIQVDDKYKKIQ